MTSAVKVDGERLYKKAHRGEIVETPVKEVEITAIEVLSFDDDVSDHALPHRLLQGHVRAAARHRPRRGRRVPAPTSRSSSRTAIGDLTPRGRRWVSPRSRRL